MKLHRLSMSLAYAVFFAGFVLSLVVRCSGRPFRIEDGILSDLLSPADNPRGYLIASSATALCGLLLLPVIPLVRGRLTGRPRWTLLGAWLYAIGLVAAIAVGITTPFQQPYVPIHIYLAFLSFMGIIAGLTVWLAAAACALESGRAGLGVLALVEGASCLFLAYVLVTPDFFHDRRDWLALCEWALCGSIALCTAMLIGSLERLVAFRTCVGATDSRT